MISGLSQQQIDRVQRDTEQVLERIGFVVQHEQLVRRAADRGARVDEASGRVRLPAALLRELLGQAPAQYTIAGLTGRTWYVGAEARHVLAIVTDPWIVDWESGQPRRPTLADVRRHTRLAQRLDEVAAISLMDYPVADVPGWQSSLHALETHLLEHDRHMMVLAVAPDRLSRWVRLLQALEVAASAPLVTAGVAVLSPLTLTQDNGELLLLATAQGFPVVPTVCPMAGTTAPYTKAGTLLQANAEVVFLAALTQLVRPGHPYLYAMGPSRTDMRSGDDLYYTLDKALWKVAGGQLGRAYCLPTAAECGGTATCRTDLQSGAEGSLFMQAAWQSGAHLLAGLGSCGNAVSMSAEMMLVQTGWLRAAQFLASELEAASAADLASLERVGPGGHFLDDEQTLALLRASEFFDDPLFDYEGGHAGTDSMLARAHRSAEALVQGTDRPLPETLQERIHAFFRREYAALPADTTRRPGP